MAKSLAIRKTFDKVYALVDDLDVMSCDMEDESNTPEYLEFNFNHVQQLKPSAYTQYNIIFS